MTRFVLIGASTATARIDGISAAGTNPEAMAHTPSVDLEIVAYGQPVQSPVVPLSPTGCPTPAVVTRAVRERRGFDVLALDAGLACETAAPTVSLGGEAGGDIRQSRPVESAADIFDSARQLGESLPDDHLLIGETIPGGTTTALGVLTALGERATVSSSLPENPLTLKQRVVEEGLDASGLSPGGAAGNPVEAVASMGDPMLAAAAGVTVGALDSGKTVTLAGGTQMAAAGALVRHAGVDSPLSLATTSFVAADETAEIRSLAADLDLDCTVTDPAFDECDHPAMDGYVAGEAKEGVGMGGALALGRETLPMAAIHEQTLAVYDRLSTDKAAQQASDQL